MRTATRDGQQLVPLSRALGAAILMLKRGLVLPVDLTARLMRDGIDVSALERRYA